MTDQELIADLANKQQAATNYIYKKYKPKLMLHLTGKKLSFQDAEDIFQDAVVAELKSRSKNTLTLHSASYLTYLKVICNNLYKNHCRRNKRQANVTPEELTLPGMEAIIERELRENDFRKITKRGLAKLNPDCRRVISLKLIRKEPYEKIAQFLNTSLENARQKVSRCRKKLVDIIKDDPDYQEMNED